MPILETERLRLRPMTTEDAEALFRVYSDPLAMRYWASPPHATVEVTQKLVARFIAETTSGHLFQWGVERLAQPGAIGTIMIAPKNGQPMAEFGYIVGREFWGTGLAREAQEAAIEFAFSDLGLRRLEADTDPANEASIRSLERLGFQREGLLRERWEVAGVVSDSAIFGLLATEWQSPADRERTTGDT